MSTPTTIQAHTAIEYADLENSASPLSDFNRFGHAPTARQNAEKDGENATEAAPNKSARRVTLDDLGGRSDALGG